MQATADYAVLGTVAYHSSAAPLFPWFFTLPCGWPISGETVARLKAVSGPKSIGYRNHNRPCVARLVVVPPHVDAGGLEAAPDATPGSKSLVDEPQEQGE